MDRRLERSGSESSPDEAISQGQEIPPTMISPSERPSYPEDGLLSALETLLEAISAKIPGSPSAPVNQSHRRAMERTMRTYFRRMGAAFPMWQIDELYYKHVEQD